MGINGKIAVTCIGLVIIASLLGYFVAVGPDYNSFRYYGGSLCYIKFLEWWIK